MCSKLNEENSEHHFAKKPVYENLTSQLVSFETFIGSWSSSK